MNQQEWDTWLRQNSVEPRWDTIPSEKKIAVGEKVNLAILIAIFSLIGLATVTGVITWIRWIAGSL